jgi:hypothetical protein
MLEDRKEFEPLQELCTPTTWSCRSGGLFVAFAALEGRIDSRGYARRSRSLRRADYVAPPLLWIDPEKEINAIIKLIENRLISREEVTNKYRGMRFVDILQKIASERDEADELEIEFPEDVEQKALENKAQPINPAPNGGNQPENGSNPTDPGADSTDGTDAGDGQQTAQNSQKQGKQAKTGGKDQKTASAGAISLAQADSAPNYRAAADPATASCSLCRFFVGAKCTAYDFAADPAMVCDAFETRPLLESGGAHQAPGVQVGERVMDDPRSSFIDRAARGVS